MLIAMMLIIAVMLMIVVFIHLAVGSNQAWQVGLIEQNLIWQSLLVSSTLHTTSYIFVSKTLVPFKAVFVSTPCKGIMDLIPNQTQWEKNPVIHWKLMMET